VDHYFFEKRHTDDASTILKRFKMEKQQLLTLLCCNKNCVYLRSLLSSVSTRWTNFVYLPNTLTIRNDIEQQRTVPKVTISSSSFDLDLNNKYKNLKDLKMLYNKSVLPGDNFCQYYLTALRLLCR
jgi:hypothetical protein